MKPLVIALLNGWELAPSAPVIVEARKAAEGGELHLLLWQSREADLETLVPLPLLDFRTIRLWGLHPALGGVEATFLYGSLATLVKRVAAMAKGSNLHIYAGEPDGLHPHGNPAQLAANHLALAALEKSLARGRIHTAAPPSPGLLLEDWFEARPYWLCDGITFSPTDAAQVFPNVVELGALRFADAGEMRTAVLKRFARRADMLDAPGGETP